MANNLPRMLQGIRVTHRSIRNSFLKNHLPLSCQRQYASALYISGREASKTFAYISPYIDIDARLENIEKLERDLTARGANVNANELKELWDFYKGINAKKYGLEESRSAISHKMKKLFSKQDRTPEEQDTLAKLELQMKILRNDLTAVKNILWDMDDHVMGKILKVPNEVDQRTPLLDPVELRSLGTLHKFPASDRKSHLEIGSELGLLEYKNPMQCYLCNEAAGFELGVLAFAGRIFQADDMIRVAGTDFSRSSVVEGAGLNHENLSDAFALSNHCEVERNTMNRMHLVGGSSLMSFLAMHTKQLVNPIHFPLRYFALGRQYTPYQKESPPMGLFTLCQASTAHAFVMVKNAHNLEQNNVEFERLLASVCKLYDNVCDHYRVILRPATELRPWETLRASFELWSQSAEQYIEVGHISMCGTYFSKRLLIAYQTPTGRDFPLVITGTVMSVPRLLGCLLEQNPGKFAVPPKIVEYMPAENVASAI